MVSLTDMSLLRQYLGDSGKQSNPVNETTCNAYANVMQILKTAHPVPQGTYRHIFIFLLWISVHFRLVW